ncbi:hypothetical protein MO973_20215 [Paenibacillus sp. TRM 82003]|nr:hypothetical protein [Paenibacillus sp. TRM 82003]
MSYDLLAIVWRLIVVVLVLLAALYLYLAAAKARYRRAKRLVEERLVFAETSLQRSAQTDYPIDDLAAVARKNRYWLEATLEYCVRRIRLGGTNEEKKKIRQLVRASYGDRIRKHLTSRSWANRMNAMLYIGLFELDEYAAELAWAVDDRRRTEEERLLGLRTLAVLQRREVLTYLTEEGGALSDYYLRHILIPLGEPLLRESIERFSSWKPVVQYNLLDVLRIRHLRDTLTLKLFEDALSSDDPELRVRALKGIANFGYVGEDAEASYMERIADWKAMTWSEKLMAAKFMGSVPHDRYPEWLEQMLGDTHYLVRHQAMSSLMEYPDREKRLRCILESHVDRYARDLAMEMIERYGYGQHTA